MLAFERYAVRRSELPIDVLDQSFEVEKMVSQILHIMCAFAER